jgi:hypothetical protein
MPMIGRLARLARSPQGRKLLSEAQKLAKDPKNRERLENLRGKVAKQVSPEKPKPKAKAKPKATPKPKPPADPSA